MNNSLLLSDALGIKQKDVVLVVGSGGKTTLCLSLCEELKYKQIIFYTTTTKMFPPTQDNYQIYLGEQATTKLFAQQGVYVLAKKKNDEGKLLPFDLETIEHFASQCDVMIAEADGSKMKPLKGWNETEPVYLKNTTRTVAVIPINMVGKMIDSSSVHRLDLFQEIIGHTAEKRIEVDDLFRVISNDKGLFKGAVGTRILVINRVESVADQQNADRLVTLLNKNHVRLDRIVLASLKNQSYTVLMRNMDEEWLCE